jgi:hypothetical protein
MNKDLKDYQLWLLKKLRTIKDEPYSTTLDTLETALWALEQYLKEVK